MTRLTTFTGNLTAYQGLPVHRLHGGHPILAPTAHRWESGVTFNSAAVYLPRSSENDALISGVLGDTWQHDPLFADGVVVAHYRARPEEDPGYRWTRSFTGLALFTPDTSHMLARFDDPVIVPGAHSDDVDYLGVEDPRVTCIDGVYYAVYCGVTNCQSARGWKATVCLARSHDLRTWEKLGALAGTLNEQNNKDGVLFPDRIDGKYLLLHRPMVGPMHRWPMKLATSDNLTGVWHDCGEIFQAAPNPACRTSWVGAGSVPIPLGDQRYLVIYHTGNLLRDGRREYDLDAAIFDLNRFDPAHPEEIVEARLDRIMVPETDCEVNGPYHDSVANVLFTCGTYVYQDDLYILYGGGDTFVMSARIPLQSLLDALERQTWQREPVLA